jgi:hypothetical protein
MELEKSLGLIWTVVGLAGVVLSGIGLAFEYDARRRQSTDRPGAMAWLAVCGAVMLEAYAVANGNWVLMIGGLLLPLHQVALFFQRLPPQGAPPVPTSHRGRSLPNVAPQQAEQKSAIVSVKVAQANPAPPSKSPDSNKK